MHCSLPSMIMTYSGKPSNDVTVLLMLICVNAASKLWQLRAFKVEVLLFSKRNVQGLIHDRDSFLNLKLN